MLDEVLEY